MSLTIIYAPPRAHEDREELVRRARNLNFNQPWTTETQIIQRRMRLAEMPVGARICLPDLTRLGGPAGALAFFLMAVERNCEVWSPTFRFSALDKDYAAIKSVFTMFAQLKRDLRSIAVTEGLHLSRLRGHVPDRKAITDATKKAVIAAYREGGASLRVLAKRFSLSRTSIHRILKKVRDE